MHSSDRYMSLNASWYKTRSAAVRVRELRSAGRLFVRGIDSRTGRYRRAVGAGLITMEVRQDSRMLNSDNAL